MAFYGMQYINLQKDGTKIPGIHFTYNKKLEQEKKIECYKTKIKILKL